MHAAVLRYRVMAYITGVVLMVLCFVGIPLPESPLAPPDAPRGTSQGMASCSLRPLLLVEPPCC